MRVTAAGWGASSPGPGAWDLPAGLVCFFLLPGPVGMQAHAAQMPWVLGPPHPREWEEPGLRRPGPAWNAQCAHSGLLARVPSIPISPPSSQPGLKARDDFFVFN